MNPSALIFLFTVTVLSICNAAYGQQDRKDEIYEPEPYDVRIKKSYINGVYIPKDLNDAIRELDAKMSPEAVKAFQKYSESEAERKAFFSFGRWMMVNWGLEEGSRLSHYFKTQKLGFVEDMVRVLMVSYHRHLNDKPVEAEALMNKYIEIRQEEQRQKEKEREALIKSLQKNGN